jgi:CubicO group peptidase (beta-lactamase class C family)
MALPLFAVLLLLPAPSGAAVPESTLRWPDTEVARHARAWLDAYNQGEDAMRAVYRDHYSATALASRPVDERLGAYRQMREDHGALTPTTIGAASENGIQVDVRTADGTMLSLGFEAEPQAPHKILGMRVNMKPGGPRQLMVTGPPMTDEQAIAAMRQACDRAAAADSFSGAVLLARDGKPLLRQAWGKTERPAGTPNTPETRFNLGSIIKLFTKTAIAQLAQQGKLSLNDPLTKWIPDWPGASASKITIAMLAEHRAGIPDIFGANYDAMDRSKLRHNRDFIPLFRNEPLWFEPGTSQRYSNGSYVLLGEIIARASGQDYYDYVRDHVFTPAGMKSTESLLSDDKTPNVAMGYTRGESGQEALHDNTGSRPARGSAAGGGYSTVDDMLRFDQALMANKLCSPAWTEWIKGGPAPTDARAAAASPGPTMKPSFGFAGGAPGISAEYNRDGAYTLIVLGNFDPPFTQAMAAQLSGLMKRMKD